MRLIRREEYPDGRFTLAFVGYGTEANQAVLEWTHNWDITGYEAGSGFGHVALEVNDLHATCAELREAGVTFLRKPGPMRHTPTGGKPDSIAFIADPDGYRIELVESSH